MWRAAGSQPLWRRRYRLPTSWTTAFPTNLVAAETGFITRIEVRNGNAVVKVGDSVRAGDLLVSGIMDNKVGESRTAHARGRGICAGAREDGNFYTAEAEGLCAERDRTAEIPENFRDRGAAAAKRDAWTVHTVWSGRYSSRRAFGRCCLVALREDCYLLMRETEKNGDAGEEGARRQAQKALALRERDWGGRRNSEAGSRWGWTVPKGYTLTVEYLLEKQIAVESPVQTEERTDGGMPEG